MNYQSDINNNCHLDFAFKLKNIIDNKIKENEDILNKIYNKIKIYKELNNSKLLSINEKNEKIKKVLDDINNLKENIINNIYLINYNDSSYKLGDKIYECNPYDENYEYYREYKIQYQNKNPYYEFFKYWMFNDYLIDYLEAYIKRIFENIDYCLNHNMYEDELIKNLNNLSINDENN